MRSEKQSMTVFHERSKQSKEKLSKAAPYENFDYATLLGNYEAAMRHHIKFHLPPKGRAAFADAKRESLTVPRAALFCCYLFNKSKKPKLNLGST